MVLLNLRRRSLGYLKLGYINIGELGEWDTGTEVNGITIVVVVARVNLGGVNLDNSPVFGITSILAAVTATPKLMRGNTL